MDTLILEGSEALDVRDKAAVSERIKGSVSSKQYGYENVLCPLITEACIAVCPKNPASFNVDNVRPPIPLFLCHMCTLLNGLRSQLGLGPCTWPFAWPLLLSPRVRVLLQILNPKPCEHAPSCRCAL